MSEERIVEHAAESTAMRTDIAAALRINNPCVHTGFESTVCEICGYPDPRKMITKLKDERDELEAERDADRRREYGYSQQTVDALTADRDEWKRIALEGWWYE